MIDIDLTEAVEAAHIFTSTTRAHGRGFTENVASCSCGRSFDWTTRHAEHRSHVQAEVVLAVREKVAQGIEAVASDRSYDSECGITEAYLAAARIARGGAA